jgi:hypothetical protein
MMIWPCAPMLNRPARNASATERPAHISGVALSRVSEIGPRICVRLPEENVAGSTMAPSNSAMYADDTALQP